jgi:hypothetical protein
MARAHCPAPGPGGLGRHRRPLCGGRRRERRDARAQLLIDDSTGFRAVLVPATVAIREDIAAELPRFRAIREKHGLAVPDDDEHLRSLTAEGRALLAITPDAPPSRWTCWGLD